MTPRKSDRAEMEVKKNKEAASGLNINKIMTFF